MFLLLGAVAAQPRSVRPVPLPAEGEGVDMTNLVVFLRFADDPEITIPFSTFDRMFNDTVEGAESVRNFFLATTYGKIRFNTVFDLRQDGEHVVSVVDTMPRAYYKHYKPSNTIGYRGSNPSVGISMREAQLIARAIRYLDENHLVDTSVNLDGNGDGIIDNVSFVIQGDVDRWGELLWPHMEYFPHDSLDAPLTLNGKLVNTFNFEFSGAVSDYFNTQVFCHEMGHSLGLPDLYHYNVAPEINPVSYYDIMSTGYCHQSVIYKHRVLHCADAPVEITRDGTYTLRSNGSSPSQNLYYIKSAIDSTQWYTFEYRCATDPCEYSIPYSGMLIGRWLDTADCTNVHACGNAWYNGRTHRNTYALFAPGGECDEDFADRDAALFAALVEHTSFGPATDPHPYLADGTPEASFEVYDIQEDGQTCTFSVRFLHGEGISGAEGSSVAFYPNPAAGRVTLVLPDDADTPVALYDLRGSRLLAQTLRGTAELSLGGIPAGVYMLRIGSAVRKLVVTD